MSAQKRWRQLAKDQDLRKRLEQRSEIVFGLRQFFRERDFLEVETPTLVASPGMEPNLVPFATEAVDSTTGQKYPAGLITSPEYALKKLLAAGFERLFEVTRSYRNDEPWGQQHNPEFTIVEWYRAGTDYRQLMEDTEQLVEYLAVKLHDQPEVEFQGRKIDLSAPWDRLSVAEAFRRWSGLELDQMVDDPEGFRESALRAGYQVANSDSVSDLFFRVFLNDIEPKLGQERPVFLFDFPRPLASLSRLKPQDLRYAERFEAYVGGVELCNAFSELNDSAEQQRRLEEEAEQRQQDGKLVWSIDQEFVEAVGHMPDAAGIALGVDRLVMLLTNAGSINDVLAFPASGLFRQANSDQN